MVFSGGEDTEGFAGFSAELEGVFAGVWLVFEVPGLCGDDPVL